ncbi:MAG: FAD-dependent oxidoreductase [Pseudoclavibacter sp.]
MQSTTDIVVVGAGAAGLTVALELQRQGLQTMRDVVVLDAESGPGGSWRRAWDALPMRMAYDLMPPEGLADFDLEFSGAAPDERVRDVVPRTLAYFEDASNLYVYRPARVVGVTSPRRTNLLHVEYIGPTGVRRTIMCRMLIDATGHWSSPYVPWLPGMRDFTGRHIAAARLQRFDELDGKRVLVVGGGRTAVDLMLLLEGRAARLEWSTRREPEFRDERSGPVGSAAPVTPAAPTEPLRSAEYPRSSEPLHPTARAWVGNEARPVRLRSQHAWVTRTPDVAAAISRGLLRSRGELAGFEGGEALFTRGDRREYDVVVWATGSHVPLRHLAPLRLRGPSTSYRASSGWNRRDGRVAIVGHGTEVRSDDALAHAVAIADDAVDSLDWLR